VGEDSREIIKACRHRDDIDRAALVDLIIGHVSSAPSHEVTLSETLSEKYALRSRLFADEAEDALRRKGSSECKRSHPRTHIIGATAGMIRALLRVGLKFQRATWSWAPGETVEIAGHDAVVVEVR
jgi:hypothetical protein